MSWRSRSQWNGSADLFCDLQLLPRASDVAGNARDGSGSERSRLVTHRIGWPSGTEIVHSGSSIVVKLINLTDYPEVGTWRKIMLAPGSCGAKLQVLKEKPKTTTARKRASMPTAVKPMTDASRKSSTAVLRLKLTVVIEKDGGSYHAFCPAFKGLHVDGSTEKEALHNARLAANVYLNSLAAHGDPLPIGPDCSIEQGEQIPTVPPGAMLRHLELQWPSLSTSGIS